MPAASEPNENDAIRAHGRRVLVADAPKTFDEFKVDLKQLHDAIGSVRREHTAISTAMSAVGSEFSAVKDAWGTPSTASYDDVQAWFIKASGDLEDLLHDMTNRLQTAYENYKHAEETNVQNNTPHGGGPSTDHKGGKNGAVRTAAVHHGDQHPAAALARAREALHPDGTATATLRDGVTPAQPAEHATARLREAAEPLRARVPSTPPNFE
jgi:uncharacterized protein YukE